MKNTMLQVGERIKNLRLQNKLTQKELANKVGVTHEWICKIERGKAKNITISLLNSIVDNLESNFNDLDVI
jgi:transcriptional regulator with XRE-family HTH domain